MLQMQTISLFIMIAAVVLAFSVHRVYSHRVGRARNHSKFPFPSKQGCTRKQPRRRKMMTDPIRIMRSNANGSSEFSGSLWQFMNGALGNTLSEILTDAEFMYMLQFSDTGDEPTSLAHWQTLLQNGDFGGAPERGMYFDLAKLKQIADMVVAQPRIEPPPVYKGQLVPEYH